MKGFGKRMLILREYLSYNQNDFAKLLGVSPGSLSEVEKEKRNLTFKAIVSICGILSDRGINLEWLLIGKGEMASKTSEFTDDENHLVQCFRKLPDREKFRYLGQMEAKASIIKDDSVFDKRGQLASHLDTRRK